MLSWLARGPADDGLDLTPVLQILDLIEQAARIGLVLVLAALVIVLIRERQIRE